MEYPTITDKNNYVLFEDNNPTIALNVLYVDVNADIIKVGQRKYANVHKSIKQSYAYHKRHERKNSFVTNF